MLTLATAYFLKTVLSSRVEGEIYATGMWFVAVCLDFVLLVLLIAVLQTPSG